MEILLCASSTSRPGRHLPARFALSSPKKALPFERDETYTTPSVEERAKVTPTLQVPTLIDGDLTLWDSAVILEYLMATYSNPPAPEGQSAFRDRLRPIRPRLAG